MVICAVPAVLGWKKKQENLAGFLEKGILAQYHKYFANVLQLFWHKYLQLRHTNICNVLMQIFGWLTNMFGTLSHLQRQELRRTSPSQWELFHSESWTSKIFFKGRWLMTCFDVNNDSNLPSRKAWQQWYTYSYWARVCTRYRLMVRMVTILFWSSDDYTFAFWAGRQCRICQSTGHWRSPPWFKRFIKQWQSCWHRLLLFFPPFRRPPHFSSIGPCR